MSNSYNVLTQRLRRFIKSYYTNMIIRGGFSIVTILALLFIFFCAIEYFSFLNNSFRKIIFWTYISIAIILVIRFILFPIVQLLQLTKKRISNKEAARIIGLHFPEIEDKLINILELKDLSENSATDLIDASIEKKYNKIHSFKFKAAIDWRTTFRYLKLSLIPFTFLFIIFLTGNSGFISTSTNRIVQYNNDFAPPPPFRFIVKEELQTLENQDFVLTFETEGSDFPENVFIKYNNNSYGVEKLDEKQFKYTFKRPKKDVYFELFAGDTWSKLMMLQTLPVPTIINMEVVITPPKYTKIKEIKIKDVGFIQAPEGSNVSWKFGSKNTNQISFFINNQREILSVENNEAFIQKKLTESTKYIISAANEFEKFEDSIEYFVDIIQDEFPTIAANEFIDSANVNRRTVKGVISDDYGFSKMVLSINAKDTIIHEPVSIEKGSPSQTFFKTINLEELELSKENKVTFLFTIYDNDLINGYKHSSTKLFEINQPSKEDLIKQYNEEQKLVEESVQEQLASLKGLEDELERLQKNLIESENVEWNDKVAIEETLKKYNQLKEEINQLKNKLTQNREGRENNQNLSESVLKKQEEIEKLFDEIMPEEMKDLLEEIERSLENLDKSNLQESLKKLQLSNEDIEKELDRNLKLLKQLEVDQKLENVINKLDELEKKERDLSEKSLNKNITQEELLKMQKENLEDFNKLKQELNELNKLDKELNNKEELNTEGQQKDIEKTIENSLSQLEKNNKKSASKSQELSSDKMQNLSKSLKKKQKERSAEKQIEDMETLKQILENLVYFSKAEENLMLDFAELYNDDPRYIQLMHKQGDLRNDAKIIEDSLFALSARVPQISATINREINAIEKKTEAAINHFRERETLKATSNQQYVMTSANNLAVLLSSILEQMQKDLANDMPSSQECEKPGNGQPKPGDLQKMQKELNEHLKNLEKQGKERDGDSGFSKELAELLARQEQIRMALEEIQKNLENAGDQMKLKETLEKMKENEKDIVNKNISQETILRQEEIETKLLELEKALKEQDESEERESKEGINYEKIQNDTELQYELEKEKQIELLKTTPPSLTNYYKKKVSNYFNLLLNKPEL